MKKSIMLIAAVLLLVITRTNATHIVGGEFSVQWVSGNTFHITLHFYRDCANGAADFDNPATMGIYDLLTNTNQQCLSVALTSRDTLKLGDACYSPNVCVELGTYDVDVVIPNNADGYYISYSRCCRNGAIITNIQNAGNAGETWYAEFPNPALHNSTPVFGPYPKGYFCANNLNVQDFSCTDADNDSLVYSLITPLNGNTTSLNPVDVCPDPAPYPFITWNPGYSDSTISGPISINHQTGILSATPTALGVYVFCVRVEEFSRSTKVKLGEVRRDIQYSVLTCTTAAAYPDTTICAGNPVQLHATGGTTYHWTPTAGLNNPNIANPIATVSVTTTYTVGVSSGGCVTTATVTINVNSAQNVSVAPGGPTTFCKGGSVTLTASGALTYSWSTGATTTSISVTATGTYTVTGNSNGCTGTATQAILVNSPPKVTITANGPVTFCQGDSVTLSASGALTYQWNTGSTNVSLVSKSNQTYYAVGTDANGCKGVSNSITVVVDRVPVATITPNGPTTFCAGGNVQLCAGGGATYLWSPGGATGSCLSASSTGHYTVTATNASECSSSTGIDVLVNPLPIVVATAQGPTTFCQGDSVTITGSGALTYIWSPNGETATAINVNNNGSFYTVGTDANGCTATSNTVSVVVNPSPVVTIDANGPTTFCTGGSVTLNAATADNYLWNNGQTGASITVSTSGTYSVTGTNNTGCSSVSNVIAVVANPLPTVVAAPDGPTTFCQGDSVTITARGAVTYIWSPNGETTTSINENNNGSFYTVGTDANGCTGTSNTVSVVVNPNPTVTIIPQGPTGLCEGGSVELCASNGSTFSWNNGGGTTRCITATDPASYIVTITDSNGCTGVSQPLVVTVLLPPDIVANVSGPLTCVTTSVTITANNCVADTGITYSWSGPGNFVSALQCTQVTAAGTYTVTATNGCPNSTTVTVNINITPPNVSASGGHIGCAVTSTQLTANSTTSNVTYSWTGPDGFTSSQQDPTVSDSGTYIVTVTDPSNGCTAAEQVAVVTGNIVPPAQCSVACELTCANPTLLIGVNNCDNAANTTYSWSGPGEFTSDQQCLIISAAGTYTVTVSNTLSGCTSTCTTVVTSNMAPVTCDISITTCQLNHKHCVCTLNHEHCNGTNCTLNHQHCQCTLNHVHCFFSSANCQEDHGHCVCGLNHQHCSSPNCKLNHQHCTCKLNHQHCYSFCSNYTCSGETVTLTASGGTTYLWSTGATTSSIKVTASGTHSVTVTNGNGCSSSCSVCVTVQNCCGRLMDPITGDEVTYGNMEVSAFPNPFKAQATIEFMKAADSHIRIDVYAIDGNKVATLFDAEVQAGVIYKAEFDGSTLPAGVYIYRITSADQVADGKLLLMK